MIIKNKKSGFTLIEMLVVISLLAIVVTTATHLFARIIRANQKAREVLNIKQTGDNALTSLSQKIRNTQSIGSSQCSQVGITGDTLTLDGVNIVCASNGITIGSGQNLIGSDLSVEGYDTCFTCYSSSLRPNVVTINFTLTNDKSGFEETTLSFSTTVSLRSY